MVLVLGEAFWFFGFGTRRSLLFGFDTRGEAFFGFGFGTRRSLLILILGEAFFAFGFGSFGTRRSLLRF